MSNRIEWVDHARGFGIVLVVVGHCWRGLHDAGLITSEFEFFCLDEALYCFHMPLFFFLSGTFFMSSLGKQGPRAMLASKISTLAYPYLLWSVILVLVNSAAATLVNKPFSLHALERIGYEPIGPYWFLYALLLIQLVSMLLVCVLHLPARLLCAAGALSMAASSFVEFGVLPQAMFQFAFFGLGVAFAEYGGMRRPLPLWLASACWTGFAVGLAAALTGHLAYDSPAVLPVTLLGIGGTLALSQVVARPGINRWFRWASRLGGASMAIYLSHVIFTAATRIVLLKFAHVEAIPVHLVLGVAAGLIGPMLLLTMTGMVGLSLFFGFEGGRPKRLVLALGRQDRGLLRPRLKEEPKRPVQQPNRPAL